MAPFVRRIRTLCVRLGSSVASWAWSWLVCGRGRRTHRWPPSARLAAPDSEAHARARFVHARRTHPPPLPPVETPVCRVAARRRGALPARLHGISAFKGIQKSKSAGVVLRRSIMYYGATRPNRKNLGVVLLRKRISTLYIFGKLLSRAFQKCIHFATSR